MDWSRIARNRAAPTKPVGAYANLDDLIRIQFRVSDFSLLPSQPVTSILSGRYASRLRGRGLNFEELRRYQPGDDIRTIDWKVTARTRSPHVRVYTEERDRTVLLVIDQRLNMFFGTRNRFKSVTAAELAAIGAWRAVAVGDRVGAIVFNDQEMVEIIPKNSHQNVMSILSAVVRLNHQLAADSTVKPDESMLNRVLERAARTAHHDVLIVLVSDFYGVDARSEKLTAQLAVHNDVLALYPFDPIRQEPGGAKMPVGDGSLQMEIDLGNRALRERMIEDYRDEQQKIAYFLRKISAPLLMISNEGEVSDQLRRYLGVRPRLH